MGYVLGINYLCLAFQAHQPVVKGCLFKANRRAATGYGDGAVIKGSDFLMGETAVAAMPRLSLLEQFYVSSSPWRYQND